MGETTSNIVTLCEIDSSRSEGLFKCYFLLLHPDAWEEFILSSIALSDDHGGVILETAPGA